MYGFSTSPAGYSAAGNTDRFIIRKEHKRMVFYLKINRNERYTFRNLQNWVNIVESIPDSQYYILCDNDELQQAVLEQVVFENSKVDFIKSCKTSPKLDYIVSNVTNERWRNAGYAHLTTFWHAREKQYPSFWNIDADDTCICLRTERACEMLRMAESYAREKNADALSLDMWLTRTMGSHWSFGITYIKNRADWYEVLESQCKNEELKATQIRNIDGYFSCLKMCTDIKLETFYVENLKFIHYSDDLFKRPHSSGFFHWKNGTLIQPILLYCFGIEQLGILPVAEGIVKLDMGIQDEEGREFLVQYALPDEGKWFLPYCVQNQWK